MNNVLRRCLRDRGAGIALTFAVTAIPTVGVIGIGIDLGLATQAKTQLNLAGDAAALAAAKGAADAFTAGRSDYIAAGQTAGTEWFKSQAGTVLGTTLQNPAVTVTQSGAVFTSQVSYQGTVKPYFAPIFGVSSIALGGSSGATIATNAYVSVTFLLDNSSSMLIAATQAGVNQMYSLTPVSDNPGRLKGPRYRSDVPNGVGGSQCAFACHWDLGGHDYYGLARDNNIQLRFDVLQDAAASAINQMISQQKIANQFAVTVYTFTNTLQQIYPADTNQPISTNLADGATAVTNFQTPPTLLDILSPPTVIVDGNTNFPAIMKDLASRSTASGDGSTMDSRKKALIIVTDGMMDFKPRIYPTSIGAFNPADCAAMKSLGYNIYVLYTTYISAPAELMIPPLKACASAPTNYAEASDPDAIKAAMRQLLQSALNSSGRYTQ